MRRPQYDLGEMHKEQAGGTEGPVVSHTLEGVMAGRTPPNWGEEALVLKSPGKNPGDTNRWKAGF